MKTNKKSLLSVLALTFVICMLCAFIGISGATNVHATSANSYGLTMTGGAQVRIMDTAEQSGLKFRAEVSKENYQNIQNAIGQDKAYKSISYGMLIAPANYLKDYADFTLDNLFSENAKYDWAVYQDGEWVYSGSNGANGSKVRIINIPSSDMSYNDVKDNYYVDGSIIDYQESNIVRDFVGRAYMKFTAQDDKVTYQLADYCDSDMANNTRSMLFVAQKAYNEDVDADEAVNETQKTLIKNSYFNTVSDNLSLVADSFDLTTATTVSGKAYANAKTTAELKVQADYNGYKTDVKILDWASNSDAVTVDGQTATAVSSGLGKKITATNFNNLVATVNVEMPISEKADLDALGYAGKNGKLGLWGKDGVYFFTQDIVLSDTADYHERYLVPIAATNGAGAYTTKNTWGIFGNLNPEKAVFEGVIDGNGYAIKNAVIPYGSALAVDLSCTIGNNFIGVLAGGTLKDLSFENLKFEAYDEIDTYMYSSANNNMIDVDAWTALGKYTNGAIDIANVVGSNGGDWFHCNNGMGSGLVRYMYGGATIEGLYVETVAVNNTRNSGDANNPVANGVLVGSILSLGTNSVSNCMVVTKYSTKYNFAANNGGMGALVGANYTGKASTVSNCTVVTIAEATSEYTPIPSDGFFTQMHKASQGAYENCTVISSLVAPEITSFSTTEISWKAVDGATGYAVSVDGATPVKVDGTSYAPAEGTLASKTVSVKAILEVGNRSVESAPLTVSAISAKADLDKLGFAYKNGQTELWGSDKTYVLTNDIDYAENATCVADKYIVPIAATQYGATSQMIATSAYEWGIFGQLNAQAELAFAGKIDGNGYSIKNAIIPYGTTLCYARSAKSAANNNFIGRMVGGELKNIRFDNLSFETPLDIFNYTGDDAVTYSDANQNLANTTFKANGYVNNGGSAYTSLYYINYGGSTQQTVNTSYGAGLIGYMQNGIVDNVYVDAIMTNGAYSQGGNEANGLVVAVIDADTDANHKSSVTNVVTYTGNWAGCNVGLYGASGVSNNGMGSVIGKVMTGSDTTVTNCFTITYTESGVVSAVNSAYGIFANGYNSTAIPATQKVSTNTAVYTSATDFETAQEALKDSITVYTWAN